MKLRIAVISTPIYAVPVSGYSGLEHLAWQQSIGLSNLGHSVTLFAAKGSSVPDNVSLYDDINLGESEVAAYNRYRSRLIEYDIIIDNSWQKWSYILKIGGEIKCPILGVLHAPVETMYNSLPPVDKPCLVCISNDQSMALESHLKYRAKVARNGIDIDFYKPQNLKRNERYLFLARICKIKGCDIAADVAIKCGVGLDLVGDEMITQEPELSKQLRRQCAITPKLRFVGNQTREECVLWFNKNKCLLHPNKLFREPLGLAPLESQACGMPVIAWSNGAMSETICTENNARTGYLVSSQDEMEELIKCDAVSGIRAQRCREWVADNFTYQNMVRRYEELCYEAINGGW